MDRAHPTYLSVWKRLKTSEYIEISADPKLHARIKKAILKKKYEDALFKFNLRNQAMTARLVIESKGNLLSFRLTYHVVQHEVCKALNHL